MRGIHLFSVFVMIASLCMTIAALGAVPMKVHVMDNLSPRESKLVYRALSRHGFQPTASPLFSESSLSVIVTKTLPSAFESGSLSIEFMKMNPDEALPRSVFQKKADTESIERFLEKTPSPDQIREQIPATPVAALR